MHKKGDSPFQEPCPDGPQGPWPRAPGLKNRAVHRVKTYRLWPFWMLISVLKQTGSR
jgi:hypothetical protein